MATFTNNGSTCNWLYICIYNYTCNIDLLFILSLVSQCGDHEFNRKGEIYTAYILKEAVEG